MPVTINGSTGITGPDGSASTPSLAGGDSNTGMFFPAADTVAIATGGTEAMRIDSSGNITVKDKIQFGIDAQTNIQAGGTNDVDLIVAADTNLRFETSTNEQARITSAGLFQFNSGYGSVATAYGCRAWVNFNGTGTVAIRASGNVSSITDNGTGQYTVNLTSAMPDANAAPVVSASDNSLGQRASGAHMASSSSVRVGTFYPAINSFEDSAVVSVAVFR
jgi:hypothetical protein